MESHTDNKDEVTELVVAIKKVERAKAKQPELYKQALAEINDDHKVIGSIADLKAIRKKKNSGDEDGSKEEE